MKKRLFSIIAILGIGVSFCSAEDINYGPLTQGSDFIVGNNNNYCTLELTSPFDLIYTFYTNGQSFIPFSFYGNFSEFYLDTFCLPNVDWGTNISVSGYNGTTFSSGNFLCFTFSSPLLLTPSDNTIYVDYSIWDGTYWLPTTANYDGNGYSVISGTCDDNFVFNIDNHYIINDFLYYTMDLSSYSYKNWVPVGFFGLTYISGSIPTSPKFKVNYGNTSFEYELDSDLSIYLKSPVIQSGNTFTYAGSTGINLFYNGTSQRYTKSNLYLDSMFWFNNNIFTPICL